MSVDTKTNNYILDLVSKAPSIAVFASKPIASKDDNNDYFPAAVGLYYAIKNYIEKNGLAKELYFVYDTEIPSEYKHLIEKSDVTSDISHRDLLVTVDYSGTNAQRARPYTENDKFLVKIGPVAKDFDFSKVHAELVGFNFDLVFSVGMQHLDDLVYMYSDLEAELRASHIVNFDNKQENSNFGLINVVEPTYSSLCQLLLEKTTELGMYVDKKAAKAFLLGISGDSA